ncbi:MAG: L-serine ammonia-lyase [Duodenibacillus sp.]|nr:L-serine ammonia-lyase [Duodenibacillus sp.]
MPISVFEMFRIGIGPSSSHTVGPMRAARLFAAELAASGLMPRTARVAVELMGSLGATGRGHATDSAAVLGLMGFRPETVDTAAAPALLQEVCASGKLPLASEIEGAAPASVDFNWYRDIVFSPDKVALFHTNAMNLRALDAGGGALMARRYYSTGGGFVVAASPDDPEKIPKAQPAGGKAAPEPPFSYGNAEELALMAKRTGMSIADIVRANEQALRTDAEIDAGLDRIWEVMQEAVERGLRTRGLLPGRRFTARRAPALAQRLARQRPSGDPLLALDWIYAWGFAVSEENASGGRVVTSPTNGACGVIPAVLKYYVEFVASGADEARRGVREFLLTAGAVGMLFKENASISGAEVGCQGEVGVACSMAAAGLAAVLGATVDQVENAAEIGMEHNLGLTCDPIDGQVQIPCIERNAVAAARAITAARLALAGNGSHVVSLDQVMKTMVATGRDMHAKYKETSRGGLAVSMVEC